MIQRRDNPKLGYSDRQYRSFAEGFRDVAATWYAANPTALRRECDRIKLDDLVVYESIRERKPFRNTDATLKLTACITRRAVSQVLRSQLSIFDKIAVAAYCIELGGHSFYETAGPERKMNLAGAKNVGYFFTPPSIALAITARALTVQSKPKTILDPACGSGIFLAYAVLLHPTIETLVGIEIDSFTAELAKKVLAHVIKHMRIKPRLQIRVGDFLFDSRDYQADIVLMNPPYGRVRFIAPNLTNRETLHGLSAHSAARLHKSMRSRTLAAAARLRELSAGKYPEKGIPDMSRLFIRKALSALNANGLLATITSSAWLADLSATALRKLIFENYSLAEVWTFPESAALFTTVNQPTAVSFLSRAPSGEEIIYRPSLRTADAVASIEERLPKEYLQFNPTQLRLPQRAGARFGALKAICDAPRLSQHAGVLNARGELDLTAYKTAVTGTPTDVRLIRGDHIREYRILHPEGSDKHGYVIPKNFTLLSAKGGKAKHIASKRIAIPQCSYLQKKKRLQAAIVPERSVLANSCNYLLIDGPVDQSQLLRYYTAVFNSLVVEWYFCLYNSNNHIANYELDDIPIPAIDERGLAQIGEHYKECESDAWGDSRIKLEATVLKLYGLDKCNVDLLLDDLSGKIASPILQNLSVAYGAL